LVCTSKSKKSVDFFIYPPDTLFGTVSMFAFVFDESLFVFAYDTPPFAFALLFDR